MKTIIILLIISLALNECWGACRLDGDRYCKSHQECCSGMCSMSFPGTGNQYGICQPRSMYGNQYNMGTGYMNNQYGNMMTGCKQYLDKTCTNNFECCTGYCHKNHPSWLHGVCMQQSSYGYNSLQYGNTGYGNIGGYGSNYPRSGCKQDWDNTCQVHQECCSNYCDTRGGSSRFGMCRSSGYGGYGGSYGGYGGVGSYGSSYSNNNCRVNFQACRYSTECCSGYCDNNSIGGYGGYGQCKQAGYFKKN